MTIKCTKPNFGNDFDPTVECPDRLLDLSGELIGPNRSIITVRCNNSCPHHEDYKTWQKDCARYALITDCWSRHISVRECLSICLIYGYAATEQYIARVYLTEETMSKQFKENNDDY